MTLQELKYRVLLKLGVVAAGDSPNPDDSATVLMRYRALHNVLTVRDLTNWNISDDIPEEVEEPITMMTAAACARDFGDVDPGIVLEGKFGLPQPSAAERQLRQIMAATYIRTPVNVEFF